MNAILTWYVHKDKAKIEIRWEKKTIIIIIIGWYNRKFENDLIFLVCFIIYILNVFFYF